MVTPGSRTEVLRGHEGLASSAAFSPDGRRVVSAGDDSTVRVWDLRTGEEPTVLQGRGAANGAAFSPDGKRVVGAGGDGAVRVWNCLACIPLDRLIDLARSGMSP